ncbi:MAG: class I tRNA ligase family protein, partial [bacterium]
DEYEFHIIFHEVHSFCVSQLSSFYLDVLKDRLYVELPNSFKRRSSQTAMYMILKAMLKVLAPIMVHTTEEAWQYLPGKKEVSIHLEDWPEKFPIVLTAEEKKVWRSFFIVREEVNKRLEEARQQKLIGNSLEAKLKIALDNELYQSLSSLDGELKEVFLVSEIELSVREEMDSDCDIEVIPLEYRKCERCWMYSKSVGENKDYPDLCERCVSVIKSLGREDYDGPRP